MSAKRTINNTRLISCATAVLLMTAANVFSQEAVEYDTAYVPVVVNVAANVRIMQIIRPSIEYTGIGQTLDVLAGIETEFVLLLKERNGHTSISHRQQRPMTVAVTANYNSGNVSLRLNTQQYKEADILLYSLNGKRIMRGRTSGCSERGGSIQHIASEHRKRRLSTLC